MLFAKLPAPRIATLILSQPLLSSVEASSEEEDLAALAPSLGHEPRVGENPIGFRRLLSPSGGLGAREDALVAPKTRALPFRSKALRCAGAINQLTQTR